MKSAVNWILVIYFIYAMPHTDTKFLRARREFEWPEIKVKLCVL